MTYEFKMPFMEIMHEGHAEHLCLLHNVGALDKDWAMFKELVRNPKYVCKKCGRAAREAKNLCEPESL